jgi:hypothetical protein
MPLPSETRRPDRKPDDGSELTPLVTDEARGFLEGRISAEDYSEFVRLHAARESRMDATPNYLRPASVAAENRTVVLVTVLGVAIYAVVGVVLSSNKDSGLTLIAAVSAAVIGIITGVIALKAYENLAKRK